MAHPNIDERRAFVADLLNNGVKIDSKLKLEISKKFNCHVSAIYADLKYFEKTAQKQNINDENPSTLRNLKDFKPINNRNSSLSWQAEIEQWVARYKKFPNSLKKDLIRFFELVFEHTRHPDKAWFGVHEQTVNLVIGGISLAKINVYNPDYGVWLLLDKNLTSIPEIEYKLVESTQDYDPLIWAHLHDIKDVNVLFKSFDFWLSYSHASNKILNSPISYVGNEKFQQDRHKRCLNEFWINSFENQNDLAELKNERQRIEAEGYFNIENLEDARRRVTASIVQRQGQSEFRRQLLTAYGGRCPISGCDAEPALEAAHIFPYQGTQTNHITNGLPLRADIHTLFDLYLLSVQPDTYEIIISPQIIETYYQKFVGQKLTLPKDAFALPSREALRKHYEHFLQKHNGGE